MSLADFPKLFEKFVSIFPNESIRYYFVSKSEGNLSPSGLLYNAFKTRHHSIKKGEGHSEEPNSQETRSTCFIENIDIIKQRLIYRAEPWAVSMEDCKNTVEYKRREVADQSMPLNVGPSSSRNGEQKNGKNICEVP